MKCRCSAVLMSHRTESARPNADTDVARARTLTILKWLARGGRITEAAVLLHETVETVTYVAERYGWPDRQMLQMAVDKLNAPRSYS